MCFVTQLVICKVLSLNINVKYYYYSAFQTEAAFTSTTLRVVNCRSGWTGFLSLLGLGLFWVWFGFVLFFGGREKPPHACYKNIFDLMLFLTSLGKSFKRILQKQKLCLCICLLKSLYIFRVNKFRRKEMHNAAPFYQGHIPHTRWKTNCVYNITTIATDTTRSTICYSSSSINLASSVGVAW